jgi:hypothetical protein
MEIEIGNRIVNAAMRIVFGAECPMPNAAAQKSTRYFLGLEVAGPPFPCQESLNSGYLYDDTNTRGLAFQENF